MIMTSFVTSFVRRAAPGRALQTGVNFKAFSMACEYVDAPCVHQAVGWGGDGRIDWRCVLAGVLVAPLCSAITTPFELIKLQMQLDGKSAAPRYHNGMHAARELVRQHGMRILYLGHGVNTVREAVFHSVFFSTYEHIKQGCERELGLSKPVAVATAGGISGAFAWGSNLPLDCIKSRIQGQVLSVEGAVGRVAPRVGVMSAAAAVLREAGVMGFLAGGAPSIAR